MTAAQAEDAKIGGISLAGGVVFAALLSVGLVALDATVPAVADGIRAGLATVLLAAVGVQLAFPLARRFVRGR
jgi:ABC-type uncharacterized transport system permease subunit